MRPQYVFPVQVHGIPMEVILFANPHTPFHPAMHEHTGYEFHFLSEGAAAVVAESGEYALEAGDCCLVARSRFHTGQMRSRAICRIGALFSLQGEDAASRRVSARLDALPAVLVFRPREELYLLLDLLQKQLLRGMEQPIDPDYIRSLLALLALELAEHLQLAETSAQPQGALPASGSSDEERREQVCAYLVQNLSTATLEELSRRLHFSRRQMARFLQEKMNENFSVLLRKYRIEHAKRLIAAGKHSLEEIAFLCGYHSYRGFYLAFVQYTGKNPAAYREQDAAERTPL